MKRKPFLLSILIILALILTFAAIYFTTQNTRENTLGITDSVENNLQSLDDDSLAILNINNTQITLEAAVSSWKKSQGLMNRKMIGDDEGMLFVFNDLQYRNFWMLNTLASLDIIFLDQNLEIINIHKNTETNQTSTTYPSNAPAMYVIELKAGKSDEFDLKTGQKLEITNKIV